LNFRKKHFKVQASFAQLNSSLSTLSSVSPRNITLTELEMQRTYDESGKRKLSFSFGRFITNAVPNFANSTEAIFTVQDLDNLFDFQQVLKPPQRLIPQSLYVGKITQEDKTGGKVLEKLEKLGIVHPGPPYISTKGIGPNFANQIATISSFAQKRLVCMLFDWEEECRRWAVLEDEEKEIKTIEEETRRVGGDVGHYEKRLLEIEGLKKLKPSMRAKQHQQHPPSYQEAGPAS
jgi:hypothetical protein